jgi:hypothetical protein
MLSEALNAVGMALKRNGSEILPALGCSLPPVLHGVCGLDVCGHERNANILDVTWRPAAASPAARRSSFCNCSCTSSCACEHIAAEIRFAK